MWSATPQNFIRILDFISFNAEGATCKKKREKGSPDQRRYVNGDTPLYLLNRD